MKKFIRSAPRFFRIACAAVSFCLLFASVWLSWNIPLVFGTQAGSKLLSVVSNAALGAVAAVCGVLLLTAFCGRVYCSFLCPLGILQDLMGIFRRRPYRYEAWKRTVRTPAFFLMLGAALCGFLLPLTLLMPSSVFVLFVNNIFREIVQTVCGTVLAEPVTVRPMPGAMILSWALFLLLFVLVRRNGRTFCNTLCPLGALLGYCARRPYVRISIAPDSCVSCGACEKRCKGSCIDAKNKTVHSDECVMCLNCLSVCPKNALKVDHGLPSAPDFRTDRRSFLHASGSLAGGVLAGGAVKAFLPFGGAAPKPVMPPGAGEYSSFAAKCLRCGLCISACGGKVLKAAGGEYGLSGFMAPVLDPVRGACDFFCHRCSEICPCGALKKLTLEEKQQTRIGLASVDPHLCVAYVAEEDCGACAEHCPVGALEMVPHGKTRVPEVSSSLCIGCGACRNICPVRPEAAISVSGVSPQTLVEKPKAGDGGKLAAEEDFPF